MPLTETLYKYVCIEGVIGAGKTSLARKLAQDLNARLVLEEFLSNAFLERFYKHPERYAFPVEIGFLAERYQQLVAEFREDLFSSRVIADYHFFKSDVFASINLNPEHYTLFRRLYDIFVNQMPAIDLLIYLYNDIESLQRNIGERGRSMEKSIPTAYLKKLQGSYLQQLAQFESIPVLVLDMTDLDFVRDEEVYSEIKKLLSMQFSPGIHRIRPADADLNL